MNHRSGLVVLAALCVAMALIALDGPSTQSTPLGFAFVFVTTAVVIGALVAYIHFIRVADELLRKIQLDALAMGFGAGAVFSLCYRLFERVGAPRVELSAAFVVMMVFWAFGQYVGLRRYLTDEAQ